MNFKILSTCLLLNAYTFAQLPKGEITSLNANYNSPEGTGKATYINIEDFGEYRNQDLFVENQNGLLRFIVDDKNFELDLSMLGINDAEKINLNTVNFKNNDAQILLNASKANATDPDFKLDINGAAITCNKTMSNEDIKKELLGNCLKYSKISLNKLNFNKENLNLESLVSEEVINGDSFDLSALKIDITNGVLKAEMKSSISQGITLKLEGRTSYQLENNLVEIRIDKAKAGILNIKGKLFEALEKMDSETISVSEPYIRIQLKD